MIKAILFDVDGTLAETEEIHRVAFNKAFAVHGLSWEWSQQTYRRLLDISGGKERIRFFLNTHPDDAFVAKDVGKFDVDTFIRALHATKTNIYTQLIDSGAAKLRPGVIEVLELTQRLGIRRAIVTTTTLANVEALLGSTLGKDGMALFETICAGDSVPAKKPAPDIYLAALTEMNLAPEECLAIEDSRNGLVSASAAGIPTVVTPGVYTSDQKFDEALIVTENLQAAVSELVEQPVANTGIARTV